MPTTIRVEDIEVLADIQPRANSLNQEHVGDLLEALELGAELPAVVVYLTPDDRYVLSEGFHRHEAYRRSNRGSVPVEVRRGNYEDAKLNAMASNQAAALKRTREDKRRAVEEVMKMKPHWSDRQLAQFVGVSHTFVAGLRRPEPTTRPTGKPLMDVLFPAPTPTPPLPLNFRSDELSKSGNNATNAETGSNFGEEDDEHDWPNPKYEPPFTRPGKPPPPKKEYPEPYGSILDALSDLSRKMTLFVNSDDSEKFRHYVGELKLGWINYTRSKIQNGKKVNPNWTAFQAIRALLKAAYRDRKIKSVKQLRELIEEEGGDSLDLPGAERGQE